jgi:hypothetical protein
MRWLLLFNKRSLLEADFEQFEEDCLEQDGLALVECTSKPLLCSLVSAEADIELVDADTMDMQANGCIVNLDAEQTGRRQMQHGFLTTKIGADSAGCPWDEFDDIAEDVDE